MFKIVPFYPPRPSCLKGIKKEIENFHISLKKRSNSWNAQYINFSLTESKTELEKRSESPQSDKIWVLM
jgi:hypothetical protein